MKRPQKRYQYQWVILGGAILSGLCMAVAFAGSRPVQHSDHNKTTAVAKSKIISVQTQAVKVMTIEDSIKALGTLAPSQEVTLSFDAAGHITKINYKNGQYVKKGAIIAELNNASEEAELKSLLADAQVKALDYQRYLKLSKIGGVSEQTLDK
ncbi:biotin/lipoyl-binding protein, partial [Piscirickettsia litoralis]|uniref:biotin/lipoyl-binding protein n=1 Tax=Piscirickettsia litoralis TaxID=1891921 RepID=UPI001F2C5B5C